MNKIINLTQHPATPAQIAEGVVDLQDKSSLSAALNFESLPSSEEVAVRASIIAELAAHSGCQAAMIGGAPYLMSALEQALKNKGIQPLYAFSERKSVEVTKEDGSVEKKSVFSHLGFVKV